MNFELKFIVSTCKIFFFTLPIRILTAINISDIVSPLEIVRTIVIPAHNANKMRTVTKSVPGSFGPHPAEWSANFKFFNLLPLVLSALYCRGHCLLHYKPRQWTPARVFLQSRPSATCAGPSDTRSWFLRMPCNLPWIVGYIWEKIGNISPKSGEEVGKLTTFLGQFPKIWDSFGKFPQKLREKMVSSPEITLKINQIYKRKHY